MRSPVPGNTPNSGALVEQGASHPVAGLEYRQIGQKRILSSQLRDHIPHQVRSSRVSACNRSLYTPFGLWRLLHLLASKTISVEVRRYYPGTAPQQAGQVNQAPIW